MDTLHAYISALAHNARVLLVGNDFELLQKLAVTEVKELVIFDKHADPNAPTSETPLGAPLRFRADWKERPRSKDLILDFEGALPKVELERLLKKDGIYLSLKKRRLGGFEGQGLESRNIGVRLLGPAGPTEKLEWSTTEKPPEKTSPLCWVFSRSSVSLSTRAYAHAWSPEQPPEIGEKLEELGHALSLKDEALSAEREHSARSSRENQKLIDRNRALESQLATALSSADKQQTAVDELVAEKTALEKEVDELSHVAASLKADENRFNLLDERFKHYQAQSRHEVESLQKELRELAAPASDLQVIGAERDQMKAQLNRVVASFDALFQSTLAAKKVPKLPPIQIGKSDAPFKLWLEKLNVLMTNQQRRLETDKTELSRLRKQVSKLERQLSKTVAHKTDNKVSVPTVKLDITTTKSTRRETHLESQLKLERERRMEADSILKTMLERVQGITKIHAQLYERMNELAAQHDQEKASRLAAETDQRLLKLELDTKHAELAERGAMLDTYASLQSLLSDSLNQAEDARLEAEDGRRLADENLRILRQEYERLQSELSEKGLTE